jgi:PAS domain S-box-containing protein
MNRLKPENAAAEISRLNHDLARRAQELAMLNKAGQMMTSSLDLNAVLATALDEVIRLLDVVGASVWLLEPAPGEGPRYATRWLVCREVAGAQQDVVRNWRLAPGQGIVGWVAQNGQPLIVPDVQADGRHFQEVDQRTGIPIRSILSAPLQVKNTVIGVLEVVDTRMNRFTADDLTLVEPLAAFAAIAMENARLYAEAKRLRDFNEEIVQSIEEGVLLENAAGYITFANTKMTDLLDIPAADLFGQHWTGLPVAESLMPLHEWVGEPPENPATHYETELVAADGRRIPVFVSGRLLWSPAPNQEEAHFAGILAVFTDITARKEGEAALLRRNKDLATLNAIATAIGQPMGLDKAFRVILDKALEVTNMPAGAIHLLDISKGTLNLAAQHGLRPPYAPKSKPSTWGKGRLGRPPSGINPLSRSARQRTSAAKAGTSCGLRRAADQLPQPGAGRVQRVQPQPGSTERPRGTAPHRHCEPDRRRRRKYAPRRGSRPDGNLARIEPVALRADCQRFARTADAARVDQGFLHLTAGRGRGI